MSATPANRPYRWLAEYYDRIFTGHHAWFAAARETILGDILPKARSVCDLCCGTGTMALLLARQGRDVCGVDLSRTMCRIARQKVKRAGLTVPIYRADMRSFRLPHPVDLVLCEYDALNHVPRPEDLALVARAVSRALRPGGWFYFDVNNRLAFEKIWPGTWFVEKPGLALCMHGGYDRERDRGWTRAEWFIREGRLWRRHREVVEQVAWTQAEMRHTLQAAGFASVRAWDAAAFRTGIPNLTPGCRTFYLARKAGTFQPSTSTTGRLPPKSRG